MKPTASQDDLNPLNGARNSHSGPPVPFDTKAPTDSFEKSWNWYFKVRELASSESAQCHVSMGADDLATLWVDGKQELILPPRGPEGGGKYKPINKTFPIGPGTHSARLDYENITIKNRDNNVAKLTFDLEVEIINHQTGSSSSYVPPSTEPIPVDTEDEGDPDPCASSSGGSSSSPNNSSSHSCPDQENGEEDPEDPFYPNSCSGAQGGSNNPPSARALGNSPSVSGKTSSAGRSVTTQTRKTSMIWRTNFGTFRGMEGIPGGFMEIVSCNYSPRLWTPAALQYLHPMASRILPAPESPLGANMAFQIQNGGTNANYYCYAGADSVGPIGGSQKRGGSASISYGPERSRNAGSPSPKAAQINVSSGNGNTVSYAGASVSGLGSATAYQTKLGSTWTAEEFSRYLDIVRAPDDSIRQIWNLWDGLANLEEITATGYRIALYLPEQVGEKNTVTGFYPVTGAPFKTFTISGDPETRKLSITEQTAGRSPYITRYWQERGGAWCMSQGEGEEAIYTLREKRNISFSQWELITTIQRGENGDPISRVCENYSQTSQGNLCTSRIEAYGTSYARETTYAYNSTGQLIRETAPDGSVKTWAYDLFGRETVRMEPWAGGGNKGTYTYYRHEDHADPDIIHQYTVLTINAARLTETHYTYLEANHVRRVEKRTTALGAEGEQLEITETWLPSTPHQHARGQMKMKQAINGQQSTWTYQPENRYGALYSITRETQLAGASVPGHSTRQVSYISTQGNKTREEQYVQLVNGTWALKESADYEYDKENRWIKRTRGNGRVSRREMMCCGPLWEQDEDGVMITHSYNSARQLVESIRSATPTTPETISSYVRDALGRTLQTRRDTGPMTTMESRAYNLLGQLTTETDLLGRITTHTSSADGLTTTVTTPAGATLMTTRHADGSLLEQCGNGQRHLLYRKEYTPEGIVQHTLIPQEHGEALPLQRILTDGWGHTLRISHANASGGLIHERFTYNLLGQLIQQEIDTMAPTLYQYDALGSLIKETWKLTQNPTPDNSRITEYTYAWEQGDDGIYRVTTTTRYNAEGTAYTEQQAELVSSLSPELISKSIATDCRGNDTIQWMEYGPPTVRKRKEQLPTSSMTSVTLEIDGFVQEETDTEGVATTYARFFRAEGVRLQITDARGNTTIVDQNIAGWTEKVSDPAGNVIITLYHLPTGNPSCITDALGQTVSYGYDMRGRKTAEWGTASQPTAFDYDDADRLTSLSTWRATGEEITTNPTTRTDGDSTLWHYDDASGMLLSKSHADGTHQDYAYNSLNFMVKKTDARGIVTTYAWNMIKGVCERIEYSDGTATQEFFYNHLGNLYRVLDASGMRDISYNTYNEEEIDSIPVNGHTHATRDMFDTCGRSSGYILTKGVQVLDSVAYAYSPEGRFSSASFLHGGAEKLFSYAYLPGTSFLHSIVHPNGITVTRTYEEKRDLIVSMNATRGSTDVVLRSYAYDALERPVTRTCSRQGKTRNDLFVYNNRSELTSATLGTAAYAYAYDNIGSRETAREAEQEITAYVANQLNQYTNISRGEEMPFLAEYDAAGNQTLLKTCTGIWVVDYDANNRPVSFTSEHGQSVVECGYDYMGRRYMKKITVDGVVTGHHFYLYRGYLQIAALDLTRSNVPGLWYTHWDPAAPLGTRPLSIRKNGTWYTFGHDLTKNVTELYTPNGTIAATYDYAPFGASSRQGIDQPFQWSSEVDDVELGLVYYNHRHYNPLDGRWIGRDMLEEQAGYHLYGYVNNMPSWYCDILGLQAYSTKQEAFAAAWILVVETMEKRYEQDKEKWEKRGKKKPHPRKIEFGVRICCKDGQYEVGEVGSSNMDDRVYLMDVPPCKNGAVTVGYAHNHPNTDSSLSADDRDTADNGYGHNLKIKEEIKFPKKIPVTASVREGNGNIRTTLYNPNIRNGKQTATFINGKLQK